MKRLAVAVACGLAAACQFGGPSGNPYQYAPSDSSDDDAGSEPEGASGTPLDATTSLPPITVGEGGATPGDDAFGGSSPDTGDDGGCTQTVAICDPVHNTGCNPLQQCDVDPTQTMTATGLCLFYSASDSGPCTATAFTESCPAKSTCVTGACKALCFCDSDCPTGQCCSDTSGPAGFTLCGTCP
jgi:hypothetical protein